MNGKAIYLASLLLVASLASATVLAALKLASPDPVMHLAFMIAGGVLALISPNAPAPAGLGTKTVTHTEETK
jgi:hypothetical protein